MAAGVRRLPISRGTLMGGLLLIALLAFEIFNFGTTDFALHDLLGDLKFMGIRWSLILAVAFAGIDFAGIARLFTLDDEDEPVETWYLFGAWFLAATMNALLTWWGVSVALLQHVPEGASVVGRELVMTVVPIFVAIMVWLVRILLIGTITVAGPRIFQWHFGPRTKRRTRASEGTTTMTRARMVRAQPRTTTAAPSARTLNGTSGNHSTSAPPATPGEPVYEPLATAPRRAPTSGKRLM